MQTTLLLPWQQSRKGKCSVCSALWQCLMDKHENFAEIQHSQLSPLLHPWTLGSSHKTPEMLHCDALCCGSMLCSTGTRLPLSGPNMPFCASHFNLWGLGQDNSGRIILPPFFQLWGNLVFWQLSAFASQTWLTLVLTRPLSLHLWSNFPSLQLHQRTQK